MKTKDNQLEKSELLSLNESNLERVQSFIRFGDTKASFLLTLTLALFAGSFSILPNTIKLGRYCLKQFGSLWPLFVIVLLICVLFLIFTVLSILKFISVVEPRLVPKTERQSPLYFHTIAKMTLDRFKEKMSSMSLRDAVDELADQTYNNSVVACDKFRTISEGIRFLLLALLFGVLLVAIVAISSGIIISQ